MTGTETETLPAEPAGWVRRSVILAGLTLAVPSVAYGGLIKLFAAHLPRVPGHLAEFIAASSALALSLMTLKVYNERERVGLDLRGLFSLRPYKRTGLALLVFGAADAAVTAAMFWLMLRYYPDYEGPGTVEKLWAANRSWFFVFVCTTLYASCEEIFLRGLVLNYIRKHAGFTKALLVSSLLFSLMHGWRIWLANLFLFVSGVIFGLAYERTRSLAVPCLVHGLHNSALRTIMMLGLFT